MSFDWDAFRLKWQKIMPRIPQTQKRTKSKQKLYKIPKGIITIELFETLSYNVRNEILKRDIHNFTLNKKWRKNRKYKKFVLRIIKLSEPPKVPQPILSFKQQNTFREVSQANRLVKIYISPPRPQSPMYHFIYPEEMYLDSQI